MGHIRVTIVDHNDNGTTYTKDVPVTAPHSLASHGRVRNNLIRLLDLDGHRLTVTTKGRDD